MNRYWTICAVFGISALAAGCGSREVVSAAGQEPALVRVSRAQETAFGDESSYTATLEPITQLDLAFRASGQVEALYLKGGRALAPGDEVPAGSVLARLRKTEFEARAKSVEAQLAGARAARASGVAQTTEAEAAATLASQDLRRAERLYEGQAMTRAELDAARARASSAQSRLLAARSSVDALDARIRASHAAWEESRVPLSDTLITAPFPAVVVSRHIERGSTVAAGAVAYTLADLRQMKIRFGVPDTALQGLRPGSAVRMNVEALPGHRFQARLIGIAPSADAATRLFLVEAQVANPGGLLRAGIVASVSTGAAVRKVLPAVPLRSIRRLGEANRFAVLTVEREVLQLREVTIGPSEGSRVGVLTGLRPGDLVVEDAATGLRAGDKVRAIPQSEVR
jgi:RND family efflux transporter MFP subunit